MTVVVSGATLTTMPTPRIVIGPRKAQYDAPPTGNASNPKPRAATAGPITSGQRAPKRSSTPPDQRDRPPMMSVNGRKEAPASVAEKPAT